MTHHAPRAGSALEVDGLSVDLGTGPVLQDVSLAVRRGEVVALLGANGSGKSTLVRAVLGLVPWAAGSGRLLGVPVQRFRDWHRVGYVPQRVSAAAGVPATVSEVVGSGRLDQRTWWRRTSRADREATERAIGAVGLAGLERRSVGELSGGQQQRVLIARALVRRPEVLLLDEPTAGVDSASQEAFALALRELVAEGVTIMLVLHELGPLASMIGRSVVLRGGRVVHDGGPPLPHSHHAGVEHDHVHPHAATGEGLLT